MYASIVSTLTAQDATETNKTLVDTITVPQDVSRVSAVGSQVSASGITTLEDTTHIIELESNDMRPWGGTQQFLGQGVGTSIDGSAYLNPYMHPTNIQVKPGGHIKVSVTFNKAQTINPSTRVQLVFE